MIIVGYRSPYVTVRCRLKCDLYCGRGQLSRNWFEHKLEFELLDWISTHLAASTLSDMCPWGEIHVFVAAWYQVAKLKACPTSQRSGGELWDLWLCERWKLCNALETHVSLCHTSRISTKLSLSVASWNICCADLIKCAGDWNLWRKKRQSPIFQYSNI